VKLLNEMMHKGHLKLRPIRAHVKREGIVDHVKPFLLIEFNGEHWKSGHKQGHNVEWGHDGHMDLHVKHPHEEDIVLKLKDHEGLLDNEPIGHCTVKAGTFTHHEGQHEHEIELMHMGHVAATMVIHAHFDK